MPTINDVLAKIKFTGYSDTDKAAIQNSLTKMYARPNGQAMLNEIVTKNKPLEIKYVAGDGGSSKNGYVQIDVSATGNEKYITPNGKAVAFNLDSSLSHELVHAIKYLSDADTVQGGVNILNPGDFAGETVDEANKIYAEMGIPKRLSYYGGDETLENNKDYTDGRAINSAIVVSGIYNVDKDNIFAKATLKPHQSGSYDLIIGSNEADSILSGDGIDFLYGNDGNDTLQGGENNDYLEGGDDDDTYDIFGGGHDTIEDTGEGDKIENSAFGDVIEGIVKDGKIGTTGFKAELVESSPDGSGLFIYNGADTASSDTVIYVTDFVDGDYGITFDSDGNPSNGAEGSGANGRKLPKGNYNTAASIDEMAAGVVTLTPIALDLNGNSRIDLLSATASTNKVFFDIDNDNFREKTSWIQGGDGWLANIIDTNATNDNIVINDCKLFAKLVA